MVRNGTLHHRILERAALYGVMSFAVTSGLARWALARLASGPLRPVLYDVNPCDVVVFVVVPITLAAASLVASFLPARRVTRIDPVIALATE